jgi:hypothetical protein
MNVMNRELIYQTLFELLEDLSNISTTSRRLKHWNEVSAADMSALFLVQGKETSKTITGMPTKWSFYPEIYIYVNAGSDPEVTPYSILNPIVDQCIGLFDAINNQASGGKQTLNGLVHDVKLNGLVENDGGALGPIAVCRIPLEIIIAI